MKKIMTCALAACMLASCTSPAAEPLAKMTFANLNPFPVYVAAYEVKDSYRDFGTGAGGDEIIPPFATSPGLAVTDYFKNRYSANGTDGKLIVDVQSSSVTHEMMGSENSVGKFLGVDRKDVYHISVIINLVVLDAGGYDRKEMKITAHREISIPETYSIADREKTQMESLDSMIDDLDGAVQKALRNEFQVM
ncbi:MAG: hypothetical protein KDI13_04990 [Alphaproteobacteria bacterium]|nr:hypothetical protein [Alphaproteobacteria bacterium]